MSRLRLIFILSLVILAGVLISTAYFIPSGRGYNDDKRIQIIKGGDEWILQCDITNDASKSIGYTILITVNDVIYKESMMLRPGKAYTYIHHIYPQQLDNREVAFALYEEGRAEPIEQVTYYLDHS